ncbi:hypothetical protein ACOMICROBIO_GDFFDHBD_02998 [Vibrio sp. B1REV9]|uniref:F4 family fimbrial subunit n=1 Tax=Vibrio sp. B1REV9 TaxID=2751179 RepID=UPI001AF06763|nr:hypothetical protein [Vibrio sp. B1REV9]CAE6937638.1 hypothetical protein ACOMICROBIO_GDFFDHBD_02998 [Vibrio sp. B1REV9]
MNKNLLALALLSSLAIGRCYANVTPWGVDFEFSGTVEQTQPEWEFSVTPDVAALKQIRLELDKGVIEGHNIKFDLNDVIGDKFSTGDHHLMPILAGGWHAQKGVYKEGGYTGMTPRIEIMSKTGNIVVSVHDNAYMSSGDIVVDALASSDGKDYSMHGDLAFKFETFVGAVYESQGKSHIVGFFAGEENSVYEKAMTDLVSHKILEFPAFNKLFPATTAGIGVGFSFQDITSLNTPIASVGALVDSVTYIHAPTLKFPLQSSMRFWKASIPITITMV